MSVITMYKEHMINASKDLLKTVMQMLNGIDYALKFITTSILCVYNSICDAIDQEKFLRDSCV